MMTFVSKIKKTLERDCKINNDCKLIVALSGGADSVALFDVLCELGIQCVVAHCNFHLRGDESERDCRHVVELAQARGVEIKIRDFDVPAYEATHGVSTEMACRELRYAWFDQLRLECNAQAIAVAHHRDDNIETFFLNLTRGTGIAGLSGMAYRNGNIIRPMLDCTRAEVEEYLNARKIDYVTDSTNLENDFKRNRIRNEILPLLNRCFPGANEAIASTISNLRENEIIYKNAIADADAKYRKGNEIDVARLVGEEQCPTTVLFEILRSYGFNAAQARDVISSSHVSGKYFYTLTNVGLLNRGKLLLTERNNVHEQDEYVLDLLSDIDFPVNLKIEKIDKPCDFPLKVDANCICLDASVLDGNPQFKLRHWNKGDKISPFGMRGTKKLSDVFSDAKLSLFDKVHQWLLTRNDEILWIVGMRASRHFAVTPTTSQVIKITFFQRNNENNQ